MNTCTTFKALKKNYKNIERGSKEGLVTRKIWRDLTWEESKFLGRDVFGM
jgi:hypothetical protein